MLTPSATLYLLTVLAPTPDGYVEVIHQDSRKLQYAECRFLAKREIEFYHFLRNLKVLGKCEPI